MSQAQVFTQDAPGHQSAATALPDLAALKNRQQMTWSSGDYAVVGTTLQIVGEQLCEALDLRAGQKVLDVAAGNGNVSLAAAHRWCDVVSTDYVPGLLERGRARAIAEGLTIEFKEADAEALPFADGTFDAVVSTFGVMFTPNQSQAAAELLRVCKSGGKIGLANWTPDITCALGNARASRRNLRSRRHLDREPATQLQLPLSFPGTLPGGLQDLLWPDAQGVRSSR